MDVLEGGIVFYHFLEFRESSLTVSGFVLDVVCHKVAEKFAFVPAVIFQEPFGVANESPRVVQEILEVDAPKDVLKLFCGIAQTDKDGHHSTCRSASYALNVGENAFFVEHFKSAHVSDAFHTATLENEVFEMICHVVLFYMVDIEFIP